MRPIRWEVRANRYKVLLSRMAEYQFLDEPVAEWGNYGVYVKDTSCFVATAAARHPNAWEVRVLAGYRDQHLRALWWGRAFIGMYNVVGPLLAFLVHRHPRIRYAVRRVITIPLAAHLDSRNRDIR